MILGETKENMKRKVDSVIKFAELENFSDVRIKEFSTGMLMRLAFSTALFVDPDIVLVDEVLSVGDFMFQQKSFNEFLKMRKTGKSIVFVSHSLEQIEKLCDRAILIDKGRIASLGEPKKVIETYLRLMGQDSPQ
jgi:ABC-type polysaccharide/polyol phosphate transport system ATPase subunit